MSEQINQEGVGQPFTFTVDLAVIESLGINLYSNAAAVLSELVANAWDADANEVDITWDVTNGEVTIQDDGSGMSAKELDERYLTVAYKKRDKEGHFSPVHQRPFMGRKGIGKLSVYSLARTVRVYSAKDGSSAGFEISLNALRTHIKENSGYHPKPISVPPDMPAQGTRIVLSDLNTKRAGVTKAALRKRLARRFDVLKFSATDSARFVIKIDGDPITYADRDDLKRLQYIWHLGTSEIPAANTPNVKRSWVIPESETTVDIARGWKIEGWFGTVSSPSDLVDQGDKQESLRNIIILARTRPIQEGILDQLDFNKFFGNYVTGQIRAEFLDTDDADDIATSDRQRLVEDDERVQLLLRKLRQLFNDAGSQWSKERPKEKFRQATEKYPTIRDWVDKRPDGQREAARNMIGTIASLHLDRETDRPALFKAGVLAFERIAIEDTGKELEKLAEGLTASDVLPLLATSRSYEDALYLQILRSRLEAIERLEHLINKDELEKVLQQHLFDNLWLLDPSWEGAAGDSDMEIALSRIRSGTLFNKTEVENQKQGRIDIQYRSAAGVHMIVELKRYGRSSKIDELVEQGDKYHQALREVLEKRHQAHSGINVVFVLGQKPKLGYLGDRTESQFIGDKVKHIDGRVLYYDELLHNAQQRYREYREKKRESTALDQVLQSLDELIPEPPSADPGSTSENQKPMPFSSAPTPAIMARNR